MQLRAVTVSLNNSRAPQTMTFLLVQAGDEPLDTNGRRRSKVPSRLTNKSPSELTDHPLSHEDDVDSIQLSHESFFGCKRGATGDQWGGGGAQGERIVHRKGVIRSLLPKKKALTRCFLGGMFVSTTSRFSQSHTVGRGFFKEIRLSVCRCVGRGI